MGHKFGLWVLLAAAVLACSPITTPEVTSAPVASVAVTPQPSAVRAGPSREPADLTRLPEEQAVVDALTSAGMRIDLIGASKWGGYLGTKQRARVFIGDLDGLRAGADVILLDAPISEIRYCRLPDPQPGFRAWTLSVNGRESRGEGTTPLTVLYGPRHLVIAYDDARIRDALRSTLGLSVPPCDIAGNSPRPAEEQAVVGALGRARHPAITRRYLEIRLNPGDAAHRSGIFTGTIAGTQVHADVLFLDRPAEKVTVCTEHRLGETTFTVRVDGRVHSASAVTGTAVGPLYFAMSSDVLVRDVLRDALALSVPPC